MTSRRILVLVFAAFAVATAAAAQEPRTITALQDNFSFGSVPIIPMPDVGDTIDISGYDTEAGEPGASCTTSPLQNTAWFKVVHPGGTLEIDTSISTGTAFDSIVQLFADNTSVLSNLTELGCDDNSGGGLSSNDAHLVMPNLASDIYIVRISCIGGACAGGTPDLALAVSYVPGETPPANDNVSQATPLRIGKADVTANAEHTSEAASENATLECEMYNTVWYTMIAPTTGAYSFSSFGSYLNRRTNFSSDTKLAVYESSGGAVFSNFTELGCSDNFGSLTSYGALPAINVSVGDEIYVRVGSTTSFNLMDGSFYRLKTSVVTLSNVFVNGSFEDTVLTPWKMSIVGGNDGVTNIFACLGSYSARMAGGPGKTNTLKQKWVPADAGITLAKNSTALASICYSTNGTVSNNVKVTLKVTYSNGAPSTQAKIKLQAETAPGASESYILQAPITQSKVANIMLTIKNSSASGLVFIDNGGVVIYGDPARDAKSAPGVLPPPAAPQGLRGLD